MKGFLSPKSFYFVKFIMMEILFQEKHNLIKFVKVEFQ